MKVLQNQQTLHQKIIETLKMTNSKAYYTMSQINNLAIQRHMAKGNSNNKSKINKK